MKEVKVAELTQDEIKDYETLRKADEDLKTMAIRYNSAHYTFWDGLKEKHQVSVGNHYIIKNALYRQDIG